MYYGQDINQHVGQSGVALVSLQSRIDLSPFTKDFRAGEPSMSVNTYFFNTSLGG